MNESRGEGATESKLEEQAQGLVQQIREIGLARFVGRINSGVIEADPGYRAVEKFTADERRRPLMSRFVHLVTGRQDPISG